MNGIGGWFRQLAQKLTYGTRRFMEGRYGTDRLNTAILSAGLVACIISMFIRVPLVNLLLTHWKTAYLCFRRPRFTS